MLPAQAHPVPRRKEVGLVHRKAQLIEGLDDEWQIGIHGLIVEEQGQTFDCLIDELLVDSVSAICGDDDTDQFEGSLDAGGVEVVGDGPDGS